MRFFAVTAELARHRSDSATSASPVLPENDDITMFGPLKSLLFLAVLWLPLSFFVWFYFAQFWVQPISGFAGAVMSQIFGDSFARIGLNAYQIDFLFNIQPEGSRAVELGFTVNPMIYGYCLPVLAGLVMATPLRNRVRALQLGIGFTILILVQVFGTVFDALKQMGVQQPNALSMAGGSAADAALLQPYLDHVRAMTVAILDPTLIAFCYQFGYLVLPAISPVILWVVFNQAFIERLITTEGSELPDVGTAGIDSKS